MEPDACTIVKLKTLTLRQVVERDGDLFSLACLASADGASSSESSSVASSSASEAAGSEGVGSEAGSVAAGSSMSTAAANPAASLSAAVISPRHSTSSSAAVQRVAAAVGELERCAIANPARKSAWFGTCAPAREWLLPSQRLYVRSSATERTRKMSSFSLYAQMSTGVAEQSISGASAPLQQISMG